MSKDPRFDGQGPDAMWQSHLAEGAFVIQRCDQCGGAQFPPAVTCRTCHGVSLSFVPASGRGVVYSNTTVLSREGGYNVSIIELAEGPRMMSRVEGRPEAVSIGQSVMARVLPGLSGEPPMVVFERESTS